MTIEEMKKRKAELGLTNQMIADRTGLPLSTVQKVFSGSTRAPRLATIFALEKLFTPPAAGQFRFSEDLQSSDDSAPAEVRETAFQYDRQGSYTIDDYMALPDDKRYELIDGVLYEMASPTTIHQTIVGYIYHKMIAHVMEKGGPCLPLIAPTDVQLDMDNKTIVEPDVMIVCDKKKIRRLRVYGAPDLVFEVLSPSTRRKDAFLKLHKYSNAGVREYWLIDPDRKTVVQYFFEESEIPVIYGFDAVIPIRIWDGALSIDMEDCDRWVNSWISE